jgi:hypothetical protein
MSARSLLLIGLLALSAAALARTGDSWKLYDDGQVARWDVTIDPAVLQWIYANPASDSLHLAQFHLQNAWLDEDVADIGFRIRGNTSRWAQKKSFKVSFNDFVPGREVHDVDKLNLNGEHNDPAIARSKLCFDLFQRMGKVASRASHGELWINGHYHGLYVSVEHVDDEFLWKHFQNDGGNLWKCLYPADLAWRGNDPESYKHEENGRRVYELTTNEAADDYSPLFRLIRILHETPNFALEDSLGDYLDVAGVLEYFAVNVLTGSWDDYWFLQNNFYLYHDPVLDRMTLIPYDYDNTFGVDWFNVNWATRNPYSFGGSGRPLAERILSRPRWRNLYTHMLEHHRSRSLDPAWWAPRLDSLRLQLRPAALADSFRTLDYGFDADDFDQCWGADYENQHVKRGILEFVTLRHGSLPGQFGWQTAGPVVFALEPARTSLDPGDSLRVDAAAFVHGAGLSVRLRWREAGAAAWQETEMAFTGEADSPVLRVADRWSATLPPQAPGTVLELQAEAVDDQSRSHRHPPQRPLRVVWRDLSPLVLNEFLALNDTGIQDPAGQRDDWIELLNRGPGSAPLVGRHLSDSFGNLTKWTFPAALPPLPVGDFLLVWADNDLNQEGLHASFRLSGDGEVLVLTEADGVTILDSLTFGPQQADVSLGRLPDGTGTWHFLAPPTPGAANDPTHVPGDERPALFSLSAWPNPFNGTLRLRIEGLAGAGRLELFNLAGQLVHQAELAPGPGTARELLLPETLWAGLPSGYCLLRVSGNHGESCVLRLLHLK